jgi:SAM-dependent methyltransferase
MDQTHTPGHDGPAGRREHWEGVYRERGPAEASWFQAEPQPSLELIRTAAPDRRGGVIDVGGGTSPLAAQLIEHGFEAVTVLDVSAHALNQAQTAAGPAAEAIEWIHADLLTWQPPRTWRIWHDRAVFHFLTEPADRAAYLATMRRALTAGGTVILGTFAPDGPAHCSGLPVARYTPGTLAAELGTGFTLTQAHHVRHHTPTGAAQPFTWITARRSDPDLRVCGR